MHPIDCDVCGRSIPAGQSYLSLTVAREHIGVDDQAAHVADAEAVLICHATCVPQTAHVSLERFGGVSGQHECG